MNLQLELFPTIPTLHPYEYTDISPIPCWLQTTKTGWSPGKAIAQNGRSYYRVVWGNGQQSDVPKTGLKWKEPRRMSFAMTKDQIAARSKTVTRRFSWWNLKPGDLLWAVEKNMGIKKGEKTKYLDLIEIVSIRKEPLSAITEADCKLEGFPELSPDEFIEMLVSKFKSKRINGDSICNRIQFKYANKFKTFPPLP